MSDNQFAIHRGLIPFGEVIGVVFPIPVNAIHACNAWSQRVRCRVSSERVRCNVALNSVIQFPRLTKRGYGDFPKKVSAFQF